MKMARRRKRGGSRKRPIRIAATAGAIGGALYAYKAYQSMGPSGVVQAYSGYNPDDGSFAFSNAASLYATMIGGIVSWVGAKTGINRYLPKGFSL
jgi:hypothetical protein